jgi:hypothetical protein
MVESKALSIRFYLSFGRTVTVEGVSWSCKLSVSGGVPAETIGVCLPWRGSKAFEHRLKVQCWEEKETKGRDGCCWNHLLPGLGLSLLTPQL